MIKELNKGLHNYVGHVFQIINARCPNGRYDVEMRNSPGFDGHVQVSITDNELQVSGSKGFTLDDFMTGDVMPAPEFAMMILSCLKDRQTSVLNAMVERGGSSARELPSVVNAEMFTSSTRTALAALDSQREKLHATDAIEVKDCDSKSGPVSLSDLHMSMTRTNVLLGKIHDTLERLAERSES